MAVVFDAVGPSSSGQTGTTSPVTWSHTAASGAALLVGVTLDQATGSTTCTATYGGTSMTSLAAVNVNGDSNGFLYVFGLANAGNGGAQTVSVSFSGTTDILAAGSISFTGADTTNAGAFGTAVTNTGLSNAPQVIVTTANNNGVCGFLADGGPDVTFTSGGTSRYISNNTSSGDCGSSAGASAASSGAAITLKWATSGTDSYGVAGIPVQAPAAGGTTFPAAPGKTWLRQFKHRQQALPPGAPAAVAGVSGQVQPLPTFPPPRRRLSRGIWASGKGTTGTRGSIQPPPTLTPPRRRLSRAWPVWWSGKGDISPGGTVQPRPTIPVPRRRLSRAVVQFTPVTTTNQAAAAAPAGTIQPPSTLTPPRRRQVRAFVQFTPVRTTNALPPPVPVVLNPLPNGGSTEGALWEMARTGQWPSRPPGFGPVGTVPTTGAVAPKPGERGWAGKKRKRFFWPKQDE